MRILYLAHRIPFPPDKGDKIRSYHEVEFLARHHTVDLFTLLDDAADLKHVEPLRKLVHELHVARIRPRLARIGSFRALVSGTSLSEAYFHHRGLQRAVDHALATTDYDLVVVYSSAMVTYLKRYDGPIALDYVDVDSAKWLAYAEHLSASPLRWLYRREGELLRALETTWAKQAALTVVCSPREEEELRSFCPPRHGVTVGNGTDVDFFSPGDSPQLDAPYVVFTGAMDYRANIDAVIWFVQEVYPKLRLGWPQVAFRVVGSNPSPAVKRLGTVAGVTVTGRVDDIRPHLRGAVVAVAPLRVARGIQNKVLEALACGVPVVATPAAVGGIPGVRGVVVEEDPTSFAHAIGELVDDPKRRDDLAREGRHFVVDEYSWSRQLDRFNELLVEAASR